MDVYPPSGGTTLDLGGDEVAFNIFVENILTDVKITVLFIPNHFHRIKVCLEPLQVINISWVLDQIQWLL